MREPSSTKHGGGRKPWWRARLVWLVACGVISLVPLLIEMLYILITGRPFALILAGPSIPAIGVIWCALTLYNISTLARYKRHPFNLVLWVSALAGLAALGLAGYAFFAASGLPLLMNLINLVPVAGTVAACFFIQRFAAALATGGEVGGE